MIFDSDLPPWLLYGVAATCISAGVVLWWRALHIWRQDAKTRGHDGSSLLAPTMAVEALEDDLRELYLRSIMVDCLCEEEFGRHYDRGDHGRFGREIRRLIITVQANRICGKPAHSDDADELIDRAEDLFEDFEDSVALELETLHGQAARLRQGVGLYSSNL